MRLRAGAPCAVHHHRKVSFQLAASSACAQGWQRVPSSRTGTAQSHAVDFPGRTFLLPGQQAARYLVCRTSHYQDIARNEVTEIVLSRLPEILGQGAGSLNFGSPDPGPGCPELQAQNLAGFPLAPMAVSCGWEVTSVSASTVLVGSVDLLPDLRPPDPSSTSPSPW